MDYRRKDRPAASAFTPRDRRPRSPPPQGRPSGPGGGGYRGGYHSRPFGGGSGRINDDDLALDDESGSAASGLATGGGGDMLDEFGRPIDRREIQTRAREKAERYERERRDDRRRRSRSRSRDRYSSSRRDRERGEREWERERGRDSRDRDNRRPRHSRSSSRSVSRSRSRSVSPHPPAPSNPLNQPAATSSSDPATSTDPTADQEGGDGEDGEVDIATLDPDEQMRLMMGFGGFDSTKDKKHADASGVEIKKPRQWRQYMNRKKPGWLVNEGPSG